jgi:hypothetical protein
MRRAKAIDGAPARSAEDQEAGVVELVKSGALKLE